MPGLITPITLKNLFTRLFNTFDEAKGAASVSKELVDMLTTEVPSSQFFNTYAWLELAGLRMREWIGQRAVRGLSQRIYQVYNKHYELTFGVDMDTLDDSMLASQDMFVRQLAIAADRLPFDLVLDLLRNGETRVCYDGQYFFDIDHPVNIDQGTTGTQSNYRTSFPLTRANYISARQDMMGWLAADGTPLGVLPTTIIVPPQLEDAARNIVVVDTIAIAGGVQSNTQKGSAKVITIPELAVDPLTWYLVAADNGFKPFLLQPRQAPRFVSRVNPDSENVFWSKTYEFGADARYGAGYGLWWKLFKAVG